MIFSKIEEFRLEHGSPKLLTTVPEQEKEPKLFVEKPSIESHLKEIRQKFYAQNIQGLIMAALREAKTRRGKVSFFKFYFKNSSFIRAIFSGLQTNWPDLTLKKSGGPHLSP